MLESPAASQTNTPSAGRLVIRVKLTQEPLQPTPPPRRLSKGVLLVIAGAIAAVLGWLGARAFKAEPTLPAATTENVRVVGAASLPKPANETVPAAAAKPVEPEVRQPPDAPPAAVDEVLPDVPRSALDTIRGTIRVSIVVTIDKGGAVIETTTEERGPSRYFERLAVDASKQWKFTPANLDERRTMIVRFHFTRTGVTAQASPPQ